MAVNAYIQKKGNFRHNTSGVLLSYEELSSTWSFYMTLLIAF